MFEVQRVAGGVLILIQGNRHFLLSGEVAGLIEELRRVSALTVVQDHLNLHQSLASSAQ